MRFLNLGLVSAAYGKLRDWELAEISAKDIARIVLAIGEFDGIYIIEKAHPFFSVMPRRTAVCPKI